jgi:hypothetical protein
MASTILLFPQPFGPTIPLIPKGNEISSRSIKDLKPRMYSFFIFIITLFFNANPAPCGIVLFHGADRSHVPLGFCVFPQSYGIGNIPDKFFKVKTRTIQKPLISVYTGFVKQKYHILYNAVENVPIYGAGNLISCPERAIS